MCDADTLIRDLPKGLIKWYGFHTGSKALFVTGGIDACDVLAEVMTECGLEVDCVAIEEIENDQMAGAEYGYIVMAGVLERSRQPVELLRILRGMLSKNGKLLLGMDNRLGIRYFCGDKDTFTGHCFDGIENYAKVSAADRKKMCGRAYAKAEIVHMLEKSGFERYRFYSVLPGLTRPQVLYAEDYLPEEELDVRIEPQYHSPDTIFLQEEGLYTTLIQNGLFHAMANGYFIECPVDGGFSNVKHVTISMDRGVENGMMTIIRRDGKVEKKPLYAEGSRKLEQLLKNTIDLQEHGIKVIDGKIKNGAYIMPYVQGEPATNYFRRLLCEDLDLFLREFDRFWDLIKGSSKHVPYEEVDWENFDPAWRNGEGTEIPRDTWRRIAFSADGSEESMGIILERGYLDLVSLNCFVVDGDFVFYDQEFYCEQLPANAIIIRTINFLYWGLKDGYRMKGRGGIYSNVLISRAQLQERYNLNKHQMLWRAFSSYFLQDLVNEKALREYHQLCRRDFDTIRWNRYRMDYPEKVYGHFRNIFYDLDKYRIYLFGSGVYAKRFFDKYNAKCKMIGVLDNNSEKWGKEWFGLQIFPPEHLRSLPPGSCKVVICIKDYMPVVKQLEKMGIQDYGIYDEGQEEYCYAGKG